MEKKWGIFIKLGLKATENKGWRIREAIIEKRGKVRNSSNYIVIERKVCYHIQKDIQKTTEFTKYTMRKLSNDEAVTTDIFVKICRDLNCMVNDTMEVLTENK